MSSSLASNFLLAKLLRGLYGDIKSMSTKANGVRVPKKNSGVGGIEGASWSGLGSGFESNPGKTMGSYLHRYPGKGQPLVFTESCVGFWRHREFCDCRGSRLLRGTDNGASDCRDRRESVFGFLSRRVGAMRTSLVDEARSGNSISEDSGGTGKLQLEFCNSGLDYFPPRRRRSYAAKREREKRPLP